MVGRVNTGGGTGSLGKPPEYIYSGVAELIDEGDGINWWMKLKTSGVLTFTKLNNAKAGIEVFLVGGGGGGGGASGGGGGGGGYVLSSEFTPEQNVSYQAVIGTGGAPTADGGSTSIFDKYAEGGHAPSASNKRQGGDGGSGGGAGSWAGTGASYGGTNGANGKGNNAWGGSNPGGQGAGISTIPWQDEARYGRYSGGGGGGNEGPGTSQDNNNSGGKGGAGGGGRGGDGGKNYYTNGTDGEVNTGGGGGGKGAVDSAGHSGGIGIILIRNKRA